MCIHEYLSQLDRALRPLTSGRERQDIVRYYQEYLEEAGPEGEEAAMQTLGEPEELARASVAPAALPEPGVRPLKRPVRQRAGQTYQRSAALIGLRFRSVRLDTDGSQVRLEAGAAFLVRLDGSAFTCGVEDDVLCISGGEGSASVCVIVPDGTSLDEVQLRTHGGDITVERLEIGRLTADAGRGEVELRDTRAGALDLRSAGGISAPGTGLSQRLRGRKPRRRTAVQAHTPLLCTQKRRRFNSMKTNVFLRSTRRQPTRALCLGLVMLFVTFAFVGRVSEYLLIKQEIDRLAGYYRTVGELEPLEEDAAIDLDSAAAYLAESGYVQQTDRTRATTAVMGEVFSGDLNGDNICREMFFYGTLKSTASLPNGLYQFAFEVDTVVAGLPESLCEGQRISLRNIAAIDYLNDYVYGEYMDLSGMYEEVKPGSRYLVRGRRGGLYPYDESMSYSYIFPLTEDGPWFIPVAEGEALDLSLPEYADLAAEVKRVNDNVHAVCAIATEDMSALPETQEVSQDLFLTEGRWLDASDSADGNRVCVIPQELANTRNLAVGDTLALTLRDMEEAYTSGPYRQSGDPEPAQAAAEPYEIVGLYGLTAAGSYPYSGSRDIYIPASAIPAGFTHAEIEENASYVLTTPTVEWDFLGEAREALAPFGLRPVLLDSGWSNFQAAAKPLRRSALFNALVYSLVLAASLCLVDFLYFFMRRREAAITRALGLPAKTCIRQASLPMLLIGVTGILVGGGLGWWWTLRNAADTLQSLAAFGGSTDAALSGLWLVLLWGIVLAMLMALTLGSASRLVKRPILAQVQGGAPAGAKRKTKKGTAVEISSSAPAASSLSLSAIALSQPLPRDTRGIAYMVRFAWRHVVRAKTKSVLAILLAAVFTVALGAIHLAILTSEEKLETLYDTTVVEMELLRADTIKFNVNYDGYIQKDVVDRILDTGFVADCYLEGGSSGSILLDPPEVRPGEALSVKAESVNTAIRSLDDPADFFGGVGSGGAVTVTYFDGWSEDLFTQDWSGERGPVVLPRELLESCGFEAGDAVGVATKSGYTVCQVAGFYDGEVDGATDEHPILLPTSVWEILSRNNLVYNRVHFTLDAAQNRNLAEFRAAVKEIMTDMPAGLVELRTVLWDEELRQVVEPLEDSIALMKLLYPVVIVLSVLVAAGVSVLFVMLSAKEAAILRVQGTTKLRTILMLSLQQVFICFAGLAMGLAGILLYIGGTRPDLLAGIALDGAMCAALYFAAGVLGAAASSAAVTNKNPLEMLQVKE